VFCNVVKLCYKNKSYFLSNEMGVPKFYRWISERYPCLSEVLKEYQVCFVKKSLLLRPVFIPGIVWDLGGEFIFP